jgi:hypothetical protein
MRYTHPLLVVLLVIVGLKLSDQVYRWLAYGPERARVRELRGELVDAGAQIVRTRQQSDSMRAVLRAEDAELEREVQGLRRYDDFARDGVLPTGLYGRYRSELNRYNDHVSARNAKLQDWREVLDRNHLAVSRYTLLADSARDLAVKLGDPYYAVPTPAEAAIERGVIRMEATEVSP